MRLNAILFLLKNQFRSKPFYFFCMFSTWMVIYAYIFLHHLCFAKHIASYTSIYNFFLNSNICYNYNTRLTKNQQRKLSFRLWRAFYQGQISQHNKRVGIHNFKMAAENTPFTSCSCENTKTFIIPRQGQLIVCYLIL